MREIRMPSLSAARAASLCLMAAALAGLAWWVGADGALAPGRHARRPRGVPPSGAEQAAAWLAPGAARLDVRVAGALSGAGRGAAVLSVNGGPPQAYAIGDALTGTARLADIEAQALIVEQSGERIRLPMPALQDSASGGLTAAARQ